MSPADLEAIQAIRILLAVGFFFVLAALIADNVSDPPARVTSDMVRRRNAQSQFELCKLHQRPLKDCPPASHNLPGDTKMEELEDDPPKE